MQSRPRVTGMSKAPKQVMVNLRRQRAPGAQSSSMVKAEDGAVQVKLPKELVENIVTRIPFPHILKVRQLSKEWKSEFPKVANQVSTSWPVYFPASIYDTGSGQSWGLEVYDPVVNWVKRIGTKNFEIIGRPAANTLCAALLVSLYDCGIGQPIVRVTNILTCQSRIIICPMGRSEHEQSLYIQRSYSILVTVETDYYELIICFPLREHINSVSDVFRVYVYNSSSRTWIARSFEYETSWCHFIGACAYMDGSLYCIPHRNGTTNNRRALSKTIMRNNLRTGATTETAHIEFEDETHGEWLYSGVGRCGSRLTAITFEYSRVVNPSSCLVKIFHLDPDEPALVELTRTLLNVEGDRRPATSYIRVQLSSKCVYILQTDEEILSTYDVNSDTWSTTTRSSVPERLFWPGTSSYVFEPGLNSFVVP